MTKDQLDTNTLYTEGSNSLRHYSSAVLNTKNIAIAQGFVILTAAGYLIRERAFGSSLSISLFGLLFTYILYRLQENYWSHFNAILDAVVDLETNRKSDNVPCGHWKAYKEGRDNKRDQWLWKFFVATGPFVLLLFALVVIIIIDLIQISREGLQWIN
jgi:hypothetical protein